LAYHNLAHIEDCLEKFARFQSLADDPRAVELAIWFHDIVYDPRAKDNEERSADEAAVFLQGTEFVDSVRILILATEHNEESGSRDARLLCDIDLSILGSERELYQTYSKAIREEYAWVSDEEYRAGRAKVLRRFLDRSSIYGLSKLRECFEERARLNLEWEIENLE